MESMHSVFEETPETPEALQELLKRRCKEYEDKYDIVLDFPNSIGVEWKPSKKNYMFIDLYLFPKNSIIPISSVPEKPKKLAVRNIKI
jgi:adenine specific DNA methylase Mod